MPLRNPSEHIQEELLSKMTEHTGICFLLPLHTKIVANWPFAKSLCHTSHLGLCVTNALHVFELQISFFLLR